MSDVLDSAASNGEYDPSKFYLDSSDNRGHSGVSRVRQLPDTINQVAALVSSGKTVYRTGHDFYRDATVHRIKQIQHYGLVNDLEWISFAKETEASASANTYLERLKQRESMMEKAQKLMFTDDKDMALALIKMMADSFPPGNFKDGLMSMIQRLGG